MGTKDRPENLQAMIHFAIQSSQVFFFMYKGEKVSRTTKFFFSLRREGGEIQCHTETSKESTRESIILKVTTTGFENHDESETAKTVTHAEDRTGLTQRGLSWQGSHPMQRIPLEPGKGGNGGMEAHLGSVVTHRGFDFSFPKYTRSDGMGGAGQTTRSVQGG